MLRIPDEASSTAGIVGIDPGTETLGVGVIDFDIQSLEIVQTRAFTFVGSKMMVKNSWIEDLHGARHSRIYAHEDNLVRFLEEHDPLLIACESPFFSPKRPQAFEALTQAVASIRRAVLRFDPWRDFVTVDPPTAKKAVGAMGNAKKPEMLEAISKLPHLHYAGDIALEDLDEHSVDGIAIAYWRYRNYLERLCSS